MDCEGCRNCRQALAPQEPIEAVAEKEQLVCVEEPTARKAGRPKKGTPQLNLEKWMLDNRPGIYQVVDKEQHLWLCRLCNRKLKLQRDGLTFVRKHEDCQLHAAKLQLVQNNAADSVVQQEQEQKPCMGILLDQKTDSGSYVAELLQGSQQSIRNWVSAGMPHSAGDEKGKLLQSASFVETTDGILFRHTDCSGEQSYGPCHKCFSLSRNVAFINEIKRWSWRLDQVQLSHCLVLGTPEELRETEECVRSRDYFQHDQHGKELARLLHLNPIDAVCRIKTSICSIPHGRRSMSLQSLIDLRLSDFRSCSPREMERSVFLTMVNKYQNALAAGTCHKEEFELAAMLAAGKLRGEPVVEALLKSVIAKICRTEKGCTSRPCSSKFINNEMAMELLVVLGKSKASEELLQFLGNAWQWLGHSIIVFVNDCDIL